MCFSMNGCFWRITTHSVDKTKVLKVHIFNNRHNYYANVEHSSQLLIPTRKGVRIIEQVIKSTPKCLPYQIYKDFKRSYNVSWSIKQAWKYDEIAKKKIYGLLKKSLKLLSWLCERLVDINSGTIVKYIKHSENILQFLISHSFSIQGLLMDCQLVIAIDSTQIMHIVISCEGKL